MMLDIGFWILVGLATCGAIWTILAMIFGWGDRL